MERITDKDLNKAKDRKFMIESRDAVSRMAQFNRHRKNATVDPKFADTPWKDNGYVAWNLWGGTSGVNWAIRKMETIRNNE